MATSHGEAMPKDYIDLVAIFGTSCVSIFDGLLLPPFPSPMPHLGRHGRHSLPRPAMPPFATHLPQPAFRFSLR